MQQKNLGMSKGSVNSGATPRPGTRRQEAYGSVGMNSLNRQRGERVVEEGKLRELRGEEVVQEGKASWKLTVAFDPGRFTRVVASAASTRRASEVESV